MFALGQLMFKFFRRLPRIEPRQISFEELCQDINFAFGNKTKKYFDYFDSKYTVDVLENMEQHQLLQMVSLLAQSFVKKTRLDVCPGHTSQIITMLYRVFEYVQNLEDTIVLCESGISFPLARYIVLAKSTTLADIIFPRWPKWIEHLGDESPSCLSAAGPPPAYSLEDKGSGNRQAHREDSARSSVPIDKVEKRDIL
jgi:hypothetical protein